MNISMRNIRFSYEKNLVLNDVSFAVKAGEIRALLGENGAGKSTLMNLLGGVLQLQNGEILIDGTPVRFSNSAASLDSGIGFVHQELNLVGDLTVYENMFLTHFLKKGPFLNRSEMISRTQALFDSLNIPVNPCAMVRELDVSYKQIVEICRALLQNAKVIIMDEPTTSLTEAEIRRVFHMIKTLRNNGVAIIFISHKLNEVMEICDTYTVLRNGSVVAEGNVSETSVKELSEHLVGHVLDDTVTTGATVYGQEILRLEDFSDGEHFFDVNLSVHAGEILGVTGLLGDGRAELFMSVFGAQKGNGICGNMYFCSKKMTPKNTTVATKAGIAYLPRNRAENGIIKDMSTLDNGTIVKLPEYRKGCFIDNKARRIEFAALRESLRIKMGDENEKITGLSGGNQQKTLLAKWIAMNPKLLILDNPTQGVDVGAKEGIYDIIRTAAENGTAVVVLSPEAQEITRLCERSIVMFHGHVAAELQKEECNEYRIMYYATGGTKETFQDANDNEDTLPKLTDTVVQEQNRR